MNYEMIPDELLEAYRSTLYCVDGFLQPISIGKNSSEADDFLAKYGLQSWSYITAFNPGSVQLTDDENEVRNQQLYEELCRAGYCVLKGSGQGMDMQWPPEPSYFIAGISRDQAVQTAQRYGQFAVVFGELGKAAELVITAT